MTQPAPHADEPPPGRGEVMGNLDGVPPVESEQQRLIRNYAELLQEVRVSQAGVQILFAFLLSLAFLPRFETLTGLQKGTYVVVLLAAATSVVFFIAPAAAHRLMSGRGLRAYLIVFTGRLATAGLICLAITMIGGVGLVVDLVIGRGLAIAAVVGGAGMVVGLWWLLPMRVRHLPQTPVQQRPARPLPGSTLDR